MIRQPFEWQRAVIKVGSALISPQGDGCQTEHLLALARFIIASRQAGREVVLVSSGSVAAGRNAIGYNHYTTIAEKQAMAAVGQTRMMANWARLFDFPTAQILLTHDDMANRQRFLNIKNTLRELLKSGVLAIINENDSVATDELKFGDNDNLAALVALVSDADTLMICTDVDGLYDADPKSHPEATLIHDVEHIDKHILALAGSSRSAVGTGGMQSKLRAAQKATEQGIQTLIINGRDDHAWHQLASGTLAGTRFLPRQSRVKAKKYWLKQSLKSKGKIEVDKGAYDALSQRGASLLPAGITSIEGGFNTGDPVDLCFQGQSFGRGLTLFSAGELRKIKGLKSHQFVDQLGYPSAEVAVHRDDLVVFERQTVD